jgi:hypothetical protein
VKKSLIALGVAIALCFSVLLTGCDDAHAAAGAPPPQLSALPDATGAVALADPADKGGGQACEIKAAMIPFPPDPAALWPGLAVSGPGEGEDGNGEPEPAEQPEAIPIDRAG